MKYLLQLWAASQGKDANAKAIAKHLSRVLLWELKGKDTLYPDVKDKYERLEKRMSLLKKPIFFVEGFRSAKRQDGLSSSVTRAMGLESYHQYGLAVDIAFKRYKWNPPKGWWDVLKVEAEKVGLQGIGSWDPGHFEYHTSFTWRDLKSYFKNYDK